jgi:hypothetical protein
MKYFQRVPRPDEHPFGREVPYAQELRLEALVSRKLVWGDPCSEARLTGRAGKPNGKSLY